MCLRVLELLQCTQSLPRFDAMRHVGPPCETLLLQDGLYFRGQKGMLISVALQVRQQMALGCPSARGHRAHRSPRSPLSQQEEQPQAQWASPRRPRGKNPSAQPTAQLPLLLQPLPLTGKLSSPKRETVSGVSR
jgi:hypothetical protein